MKYKSLNFISNHLIETINKEANDIILKISQDYNLDHNIIKKKYIENNYKCPDVLLDKINTTENICRVSNCINNNIKNTIDCNIRCLGIIKSGAQCARTRKNNSHYCLIHQKSLKFGKIHINNQT
jgi:hypothetical protein|tara:strand:- start:622 stop:996 length:375 start_codon:yes stop_codon:yes gene_type:complete